MAGTKIELVKKTLLQLLELLNKDDRLSIILFESTSARITELKRVSNQNLPYFKSIIKEIYATGRTVIASGMNNVFK